MKRIFWLLNGWVLLAVLTLAGCGQSDATGSASTGAQSDQAADDHGHDHDEHADHDHEDAPHDGTIADWGGGAYHVEFTVDHGAQQATVYILGDDAKTAKPVAVEEIQLNIKNPSLTATLKASPQESDPEGQSSRFVGNHEGLGVVQEYEGTISGVIDGVPYAGDFKEIAHNH
jgi:hypothetical protein